MASWLLYGKRTGMIVDGSPVYDKNFKALRYDGVRANKLSEAGEYATREDAQEVIDKRCQPAINAGTAVFEIRKAK